VAVGVVGLAPVLSSPYTIIQFAGSLGGMGGGFQLANSQYTGYFTTNIGSPSTITLTLTGVTANNNVVWQGNGLNNYWMVDVLGWTNTAGVGLLDYYYSGDNVFFNDTATNRLVSLQGATYPASVTVTNSAGNYGFSGSGLLAGTTGILKDGTGTLAVSNANTFTGQVTIQGGTFLVGNVLALGATNVPTIVTNNGLVSTALWTSTPWILESSRSSYPGRVLVGMAPSSTTDRGNSKTRSFMSPWRVTPRLAAASAGTCVLPTT